MQNNQTSILTELDLKLLFSCHETHFLVDCAHTHLVFSVVLYLLMVYGSSLAGGYIVLGIGFVGLAHKQKSEQRLGLGLVLDLGLINILFSGSFG